MLILFVSILGGGIILFYQAWYSGEKSQKIKEVLFFFSVIIISFTGYIFYPFDLQEHYIQSLAVAAIFITALCMERLFKTRIGMFVVVCFFLITGIFSLQTLWGEYTKPYIPLTEGSYKNQLVAVDFVYKDANGKPFGYFVYDTPIVTYGMDYLFWWRGKTKYQYIPQSEKLPITYLVMLPGPVGDIHAHEFWKKYTIHTTGKILTDKIVQGNIEIQKLSIDPTEASVNPNYYQNFIFR